MKKQLITWIIVLLILSVSAAALGIRPAKTTVNFEPNLEKEYSFSIVNNEKRDLAIKLEADGVLKDYIDFEKDQIEISAREELKEVRFTLDLPGTLTPGSNLGQIIVTEQTDKAAPLSANIQLIHKVYVLAPYPEKYIEVGLNLRIREAVSDIIAEFRNSGTRPVNQLSSLIEIYDGSTQITGLQTQPVSLNPTETKQYYLTLNKSELPNGEYDVYVLAMYDGEELEVTKKLLVGEPTVEIVNLDRFFLENEVNELNLELKNNWNKEIGNIYGDIQVKKDSQIVYSAQTVSFDLGSRETDVVETFIDLSNLEAGQAELFITLYYAGQEKQSRHKIDVLSRNDYEERKKEIQVITMPGGRYTYIIITVIAVLVFITFLVILIPAIRKRKEEERISQKQFPGKNIRPPQNQWNKKQQ